jgi:hypothetical protein
LDLLHSSKGELEGQMSSSHRTYREIFLLHAPDDRAQ